MRPPETNETRTLRGCPKPPKQFSDTRVTIQHVHPDVNAEKRKRFDVPPNGCAVPVRRRARNTSFFPIRLAFFIIISLTERQNGCKLSDYKKFFQTY